MATICAEKAKSVEISNTGFTREILIINVHNLMKINSHLLHYVVTYTIIEFRWNNSMYAMLPDPIPENYGLGHETRSPGHGFPNRARRF